VVGGAAATRDKAVGGVIATSDDGAVDGVGAVVTVGAVIAAGVKARAGVTGNDTEGDIGTVGAVGATCVTARAVVMGRASVGKCAEVTTVGRGPAVGDQPIGAVGGCEEAARATADERTDGAMAAASTA